MCRSKVVSVVVSLRRPRTLCDSCGVHRLSLTCTHTQSLWQLTTVESRREREVDWCVYDAREG